MSTPRPLRVLIVDDSPFMRTVLRQIITSEPGFTVAGEAEDGNAALEALRTTRPDIVTLDVEMPGRDGISVLRHVMPKPGVAPIFIMVSAFTTAGASLTLSALQAGALDFVPKASDNFKVDLAQVGTLVREKLAAAAAALHRAPVRQSIAPTNTPPSATAAAMTPKGRSNPSGSQDVPPPSPVSVRRRVVDLAQSLLPTRSVSANSDTTTPDVIVVACSTGGPQTLPHFLQPLARFPIPIVIAQHIPPFFSRSLADSLATTLGIRCQEAVDDAPLEPNTVYLLPGGLDGELGRSGYGGLLIRIRPASSASHHPNADLLFRSAALVAKRPVGVILTGMGNDGSEGARVLMQRGRPVLVQDPTSAVLWGMPQAAIDAGAVSEVHDVPDLARRLISMAGRGGMA